MYCFFCNQYHDKTQCHYYKWCSFRLNACPTCDVKYLDTPIKICSRCAATELSMDPSAFQKDRGKMYICTICARGMQTHKCHRCGHRMPYSLDNYVGKYPFCESCSQSEGYWNHEIAEIRSETHDILPSKRRFGIELEASHCSMFKYMNLRQWSAVHEGTETVHREFTSPPMEGDKAVEAIKCICDYARQYQWKVNERCGMHLHIDVGDLTEQQLVSILAGYNYSYKFWSRMVAPNRVHNRFCREFDIYIGEELKRNPSRLPNSAFGLRYYWVSFESLLRHNTIEIRNHEGTFKFNKIFYWTLAHLQFVEWCIQHSVEMIREHFRTTKQLGFDGILGPKITRYYQNKHATSDGLSRPAHPTNPARRASWVLTPEQARILNSNNTYWSSPTSNYIVTTQ